MPGFDHINNPPEPEEDPGIPYWGTEAQRDKLCRQQGQEKPYNHELAWERHHKYQAQRNRPIDPRDPDKYLRFLADRFPEYAGSWFVCDDRCQCNDDSGEERFHRRSAALNYARVD